MKIKFTIRELLHNLGDLVKECKADESFIVTGVASLESACFDDLAVILDRGEASVFDSVSLKEIEQSKAGVFLSQKIFVPGRKYIIVKDVLSAFNRIANLIDQQFDKTCVVGPVVDDGVVVHPSAVIDNGASIGSGACIGAHCFIGRGCCIGKNVFLHPGVKILSRCIIGDGTTVHAGAVIGSDGFGYHVGKAGLRKIPQIGIVSIGKEVEIGANCMIDRASFDETIIGDGVKIDNGVHIAHNVKIGAHTAILALTGIAGGVQIGMGCQIGGLVAIRDHVKIGNGVKIVSKTAVVNDLKDGEIVAGIPAMPFSQWKRLTVSLYKVPDVLKVFKKSGILRGATRYESKSLWRRLFG